VKLSSTRFWIFEKAPEIIALLIYNVAFGGFFSLLFEMWLLDMTGPQWIGIRVLDNAIKYLGAGYCARLEDFLKGKWERHPKDRFRGVLASTATLLLYQLPIYAVVSLLMRASFHQVGIAVGLFAATTILTGWTYGPILDWTRKHFSTNVI